MIQTTESYAIYHDLQLEAPAPKVFEAVSQPDHLISWWPLRCTAEVRLGGEYNFFFGSEYDWLARVEEFEPNQSIHFKMTRADEDWTPTNFGFDLQETNGRTQLSFWHKGWPSCNAHYKKSSYCWAILLNGLKNYVEKGIIIPFEERE